MCGRYTLHSEAGEIQVHADVDRCPVFPPRFNIAPTQEVIAVGQDRNGRRLARTLRWGLVPSWADDPKIGSRMINARSESVAEKPAFKEAFRRRRCLVLADGFYEWRKDGGASVPFHIRMSGGGLFAFAGLWERWPDPSGKPLMTCTILTKAADAAVRELHDRLPVVIEPGDYTEWLDAERQDVNPSLVAQVTGERFEFWPVSRAVNNVRNDGPELIEREAGLA
ncbi:MAG: hypothetical protein CMJ85_14270 [Planctomycetes bacterium]|jgi:putative SOS response-associated peptidase YedK|nr:hypothetical protein [Planctomycetota bacterium]MDP6425225.1 SOS response-associated peptidase [Planctomycetota bacterium]